MQLPTRSASSGRRGRPVLLLAAVALGAATTTLLWLAGGDRVAPALSLADEPSDTAPSSSTAGETTGAREGLPAVHDAGCYAAAPGSSFAFRIHDENEYHILAKDAGEQQAMAVRTDLRATVTVLDRHADEVLTRVAFAELRFLAADGRELAGDPAAERFAAAARGDLLMRLGNDGCVRGYAFAEGLAADQRNFLRGMATLLAFTVPATAGAAWEAEEADTTGIYTARYERLLAAQGERAAVRRTRLRYVAMAGSAQPASHELRGAAEARFGDFGWLQGASVDEGFVTDLPIGGLRADSQRRARVVLQGSSRVAVGTDTAAAWQRCTAPAAGHGERGGVDVAEAQRSYRQQIAAGTDLVQTLAELTEVCRQQPLDRAALDRVFQKLQALAALDDKVVAALVQQVATHLLDDDAAATVLGALGAASTAAAQQALAALRSEASLSIGLRRAATVALFQLANPAPQVLAGLAADAARGGDETGALAVLGALAPRSQQPLADGRTAMQTLLDLEGESARRSELPAWLFAVGNAGNDAAFAAANRHLDDADPTVRAAAYAALQRVERAQALDLLVQRGLGDSDPAVRAEAVVALGHRGEPTAAEALRRVAAADADVEVRRAALRELAAAAPEGSANRAALQAAAANDPDTEVRNFAAQLLRQGA